MSSAPPITLWTFQHLMHWRELERVGRLRRGSGHVTNVEPAWRDAYAWMMTQMQERISGYCGGFPMWAWASAPPTLWHESSGWPLGTPFVRIEFRVHPSRVLRSDFDAWHSVLHPSPLCLTEAEDAAWDARQGPFDAQPADVRAAIRATWPRIFDLDAFARSPLWDAHEHARDIQAVVEELRFTDVVHTTMCIGRQWPPTFLRTP